jgi:hypothetical protein
MKLVDVEVLVGFPEDTTTRPEDPDDPHSSAASDITNASLAYIHDNGMPEQNIPARPFMIPAIKSVQPKITEKLGQILKAVVAGKGINVIAQGMTQVGIIGKLAIQNTINAGIGPPLADSTLRARARKGRKGAQAELDRRANGEAPGMALAKPLVDSSEMRNAASYAIRSRKKRK